MLFCQFAVEFELVGQVEDKRKLLEVDSLLTGNWIQLFQEEANQLWSIASFQYNSGFQL